MMKDKNFDKLFSDKLSHYEQQPPAYCLENIHARVAGARRKRKIVLWRMAGVAAALLLAFVAGWQVNHFNQKTATQPMVVNQNSSKPTKEPKDTVPRRDTVTDIIQKSKKAVTIPSDAKGPSKNAQFANPISLDENKAFSEIMVAARRDNSVPLHSIKSISPKIVPKDQLGVRLQENKVDRSAIDRQELTIDEQIMEQNHQQLQAQNEKRKKRHWLVGAQVSPAYSVNRSSHSSEYASNMLNSSSNTPVELGGGLSLEYKIGKRWSLQSGVFYAGLGQSSGNSSVANKHLDAMAESGAQFFNAPVNIRDSKMTLNSQAGVIELDGVPAGMELATNIEDKTLTSAIVVSDARFVQNFQYIEIPLYLRYRVIDARFDVELMGGVSSNLLVGNDAFLESNSGKSLVGKTQDMQEINYSGTFGLGLKYRLSRRIFLNLEPRVKYYLNSLNTNSSVTYTPYTIGVYTGISYQF